MAMGSSTDPLINVRSLLKSNIAAQQGKLIKAQVFRRVNQLTHEDLPVPAISAETSKIIIYP